jgi:hypothetical protein
MTSDMEPMTLTAEQCARLKFPVGCPVWYNFPRPNDDVPSSFFQKRGLVQGAIFRDGKVFYQVKYVTKSSNFISEEVEDGKLGFGATCPVTILPNNAAADPLEGEIVLCTPSTICQNEFLYTVMIFLGTSKVMYEGGIEEKRVVYREVLSNDELREENAGAAVGEAQIDNTDETSNGQNSVMLNIFDSTNATGKSSDKDGSYDGEEGEVMEEPSAAK